MTKIFSVYHLLLKLLFVYTTFCKLTTHRSGVSLTAHTFTSKGFRLACRLYTLVLLVRSLASSCVTMHPTLLTYLLVSILLSCSRAFEFPDGQVQPGCYPPPILPQNFSTKPQYWRSKSLWLDPPSRLGPRSLAKKWSGWPGVDYLFTLLVYVLDFTVYQLTLQR